jgi:hypothetical protein
MRETTDERATDQLAHAMGFIVSTGEGGIPFTEVVNELSGDAIARILQKRYGHTKLPAKCNDILADRFLKTRSPELRLEILRALGDEPHARFGELATAAVRHSSRPEMIEAATEPFRSEHGQGEPENVAPPELLDALEDLKLDGAGERQARTFQTLVLQGRIKAVAPRLGDPDLVLRACAAIALENQHVLALLAAERSLEEDVRYDCIAYIYEPRIRCDLYVKLGMEGSGAAATQLGYLVDQRKRHPEIMNAIIAGLSELAEKSPEKRVRDDATKRLERISRDP